MKIVLVVAAHADDEALGCAGTMLKHVASGDQVHVLFMTDGVSARQVGENTASERKSNAEQAGKVIGVKSMDNFDFPDNKMDTVALLDVTQGVEHKIAEIQPSIIYTHHIGDLNIDHQVTHKAVMTACRPQPGFCVKEIYAFEVLSSTEWQTPGYKPFFVNKYVDITNYIELKKKAIQAYHGELKCEPHTRSGKNIIRLNIIRGNSVGIEYTEAFSIIRIIS